MPPGDGNGGTRPPASVSGGGGRENPREYPARFARPSRSLLIAVAIGSSHLAVGCSAVDRLASVGEKPALSPISDPTAQRDYQPVQMPMPSPEGASHNPNSLWRNGSRTFFRDQRAAKVGDIVTIVVRIADKANISDQTKRSRNDKENAGIGDLPVAKSDRAQLPLPGRILSADSVSSSDGKGSVQRREALQTNVAAVVTQLLPNGNLVVEGKQEIKVNSEVRELVIAGILRPEDIQSDNTVESSKLGQARISYGGRGQISDLQQPRYGQQVMDVLLPF